MPLAFRRRGEEDNVFLLIVLKLVYQRIHYLATEKCKNIKVVVA
jgi:hypothetical protein